MNEFDSYKNDFGFEIGSGFSGNSDYMKALDEKKRRALMEEQYNFPSNPQLSSSASFLRLNVLSSLN